MDSVVGSSNAHSSITQTGLRLPNKQTPVKLLFDAMIDIVAFCRRKVFSRLSISYAFGPLFPQLE
jgi:hypothetical protein